jgi:fatty acid amide hydrolase
MIRAMEPHRLSVVEALRMIRSGELTSEALVLALDERIRRLDPRLRCFVHRDRDATLAAAREADAAVRRGGPLPPLHGLPMTVKDNLDVAGTDSTLGLAARRHAPAAEDAPVVAALRRAGAIVLGKTNVPQLLLAQETENAVFGVTRNPWNLDRVPGGSSGGEAAALAAGLSLAGIGTDIGGSIRIPAHFCGVAGLKPTLDRWSNRGSQTGVPGQELVRSQVGPLARSAADLAALWRAVDPVAQAAADPAVPPLPAGDPAAVRLEGLRVGWFEDDGYLTPAAPLREAVAVAREALEAAGVVLVPYAPPGADRLIYLWLAAISADGGRTIDRQLAGEAISPQLRPSRTLLRLPRPVRLALAAVLERRGEGRVAELLRVLGEKRVDDLWALTQERTELRRAEVDAWHAAGIDAVLCPAHVVPALAHRASGDFTLSLSYAFRWTLLNLPAGVVPVTRVTAGPPAPATGDRVEQKVARVTAAGVGLPLGVQVAARPYREDVVLALLAAIERHAATRPGFPATPIDP